jgi:endonuclease G
LQEKFRLTNVHINMRTLRGTVSLLLFFLFTWNLAATGDLLPTSTTGQVVKHTYYVLSYSEVDEQPEWVYYKLTASFVNGPVSRTDDFRPDPEVSTGSAQLYDYKGSGYDRGHLCPAGDMKLSREAMSETFYMSNMSPQEPSFNRGIWKNLEATVRNWAVREGEIYVVTGGILSGAKGKIGTNGVTVPKYYYKVVYDPAGEQKMIALILPNQKGTQPLQSYVVSVDKVEQLTGIDFFPELPDDLENKLERSSNAALWSFKKYSNSSSSKKSSSAVQCKGIAKSTGQRCRMKTTNPNGYCRYHQSQASGASSGTSATQSSGRCRAITKAGTQCKRKASPGSNYCWQHQR